MALTTTFDAAFIRTTAALMDSQRLLDALHHGLTATTAQLAASREVISDSVATIRQTAGQMAAVKNL